MGLSPRACLDAFRFNKLYAELQTETNARNQPQCGIRGAYRVKEKARQCFCAAGLSE
jgi:hypothetical protein